MELLLENINHEDLKKYLKEFYNYAKKELNLDKHPRLLLKKDQSNADYMFGKTGYYSPETHEICLYISDRHAKDILRSFAHELIHHMQNLHGKNEGVNLGDTSDPAYASKNPQLRELEREAFERGNMIFRDWCDIHKVKGKNIMSENINEATKAQKKKLSKIKKGVKKTYPQKSDKEATSTAHAIKANIEKGKTSHGPGKPMSEKEEIKNKQKADLDGDGRLSQYEKARANAIETSIEKQAKKQAKENVKAVLGKSQKYMEENEQENLTGMHENKEKDTPYPELFIKKERLMQDAFNKREDIIYQELIRRFIKK